MNVFLRIGLSFLLLLCAPVSAQDERLCCSGNSTCVEMDGGGGGDGGGRVCLCSAGDTEESCRLKNGLCSLDGSRCQNGGSCVKSSGSDSRPSCRCPPGFGGALCEIRPDACQPNPCVNGGRCVRGDPEHTCVCPPPFSGPLCNASLSSCASGRCLNGGTCVKGVRCSCPPRFSGSSCELQRLKLKARARAQHFAAPPLHKLLRPGQASAPLVTRSQLVCFLVLALLTGLVVLVTTGMVFFPRCEAWLANSRYRKLVRQQRNLVLHEPLNVILPEKIRLGQYGRRYTSI